MNALPIISSVRGNLTTRLMRSSVRMGQWRFVSKLKFPRNGPTLGPEGGVAGKLPFMM